MESSFFEYRDQTSVNSDSDSEVIDGSVIEEVFSAKKTPGKNKTVFVAESDDSASEGNSGDECPYNAQSKSLRASGPLGDSNDGGSKRGSIRRQSDSENKVIFSSSDEGEMSPELLPKRRLPLRQKSSESSDSSFIGRKVKKRILLIDSDTENSIIIDHDKHIKIKCVKDTPLKLDKALPKGSDNSVVYTSSEDDREVNENSDEGPDEDQLVMSRATRMSIMGVIPKEDDSDDSDFIQSDESKSQQSNSVSLSGSTNSLNNLPDIDVSARILNSPQKISNEVTNTSRITCSPISSPLRDVTNEINNSVNEDLENSHDRSAVLGLKKSLSQDLSKKVLNKLTEEDVTFINETKAPSVVKEYEDEVTIIEKETEIIALSSDSEDEVKAERSPKVKEERRSKDKTNKTIKQYLTPASYPNSQVVYVKKHVRENELSKLNGLREDLESIRYLLETMDLNTLPDNGTRLIERLTSLEQEVRRQGDKVANMVVEPEAPTPQVVANDGFENGIERGLTWDDIQKASVAVQPRMFGKQAMSTHMAERNLILERLRDLHESLASRPAESALDQQPRAAVTRLMPHQLHALAWLRWRETQRPAGGILADDMGLGKTITMISLVVTDKEDKIDDDDDDDNDADEERGKRLTRGGTLVVCPASLMQQWAGEVKKHLAPHALSVSQHHGAARTAAPHRLAVHDLVLTTYNILQRDNEKNGVLMRIKWRRVILDEAHIVRNYKSATSNAVSALKARRRWCLTGTPVQNKDLDLFALLKFLRCTPFDDLPMWKKWIDNKSQGGQERLNTIMRCILLRRTKQQLQQKGQLDCLPERTAHQRTVTLTKDEMNVYQKVLVFSKTLFAQFLHQRAEKQADAAGVVAPGKDSAYAKMHKKMIALQGAKPVKSHEILVLLLRLRQVCCHCGLIAAMLDGEDSNVDADEGSRDLLDELKKLTLEESKSKRKSNDEKEEEEEGPVEEGTSVAEAIRSVLSPNNPVFDLKRRSSKITAVMDCLQEILKNKDEKAVVVSQWTSVLRLVEQELATARVRSVTLSGAVPVPARQNLINALNDSNSGVRVMLLSLCAGGVGLNLCGASHLLLLDPHWNPQLEEQAQDRVYRVGQRRHVHIYRFMCVDTVEQTIRKLQEVKLELAENVLTGARNNSASKLSIEDLKMLFNMGQ